MTWLVRAENYRCSTKPGPPHNPGHNFVHTEAEAAVAAIKAGTDMNCGSSSTSSRAPWILKMKTGSVFGTGGCEYAAHLADAVGNGTVTHEEIDLAAGETTNHAHHSRSAGMCLAAASLRWLRILYSC